MPNKFSSRGNFSFAELRSKEVVNSLDGKRLGRIIDLVFSSFDGLIMGLVLPHSRKNIIFRNSEPIFIPWEFVERVGEDIIMVRLFSDGFPKGNHHHKHNDRDSHFGNHLGSEKIVAERVPQQPLKPPLQHPKNRDKIDKIVATKEKNNFINEPIVAEKKTDINDPTLAKRMHDEVVSLQSQNSYDPIVAVKKPSGQSNHSKELKKPNCDHQCEKCMLFDCDYRWQEDPSKSKLSPKTTTKQNEDLTEQDDYSTETNDSDNNNYSTEYAMDYDNAEEY